jgi:hypothetical protein
LCSVLLTRYHSSDRVKKTEIAGHVARMGERRFAYRILVGKPEGRRPLGRTRRRWGGGGNFKMHLREVGWGDTDWIDMGHGRDRWRAVVNLRVP